MEPSMIASIIGFVVLGIIAIGFLLIYAKEITRADNEIILRKEEIKKLENEIKENQEEIEKLKNELKTELERLRGGKQIGE